jgi:tRNA (guanine-N7-)-methyltransferase
MQLDDDIKKRSIRSFVRRNGRMTSSQKNAINTYWDTYGIEYQKTELGFPSGFHQANLEIGIGNGDALISMAVEDKTSLYIGVEVHQPGIGRCLNNIEQQSLDNVRLISHDAVEVLRDMFAAESLDRILLFFPDPWHKKRHHKRRIVNQDLRDLAFKCLKPGGVFHAATDWHDYALHIAAEFIGDQRFKNQGDKSGYSVCPAYRPSTKFEQRGEKLGHGVWDLIFTKK